MQTESDVQRRLLRQHLSFCLALGLVYTPESQHQALHAPITLLPTPFPRDALNRALSVQTDLNDLLITLSRNSQFLNSVLQPIAEHDPWIRRQLSIANDAANSVKDRIVFGLLRCDYLLNRDTLQPKSVEFNTIASSFISHAQRTPELHRLLCQADPTLLEDDGGELKPNPTCSNIAAAFARADQVYRKQYHRFDTVAVMVVSAEENNVIDQTWLELEVLQHGTRMVRQTLEDLETSLTMDGKTKALLIGLQEVSIVYFRAGYAPEHYGNESQWDVRRKIDLSRAISCPSVALQLVGTKKVQQVLGNPGEVERHVAPTKAAILRSCFVRMLPLKDALGEASQGRGWVLKPQLEGGGNNIYDEDIAEFVKSLKREDYASYVMMEKIVAPEVEACLVRDGQIRRSRCISELGIYGVHISNPSKTFQNDTAGYLLRTKPHDVNEGGVAAGFAVMDSPLLMGDSTYRKYVK